MTDYLTEIMKARKEFYRKIHEFSDILDKWEDEHEKMGNFHVGFNFKNKSYNEIRVVFNGEVNNEVIDLLCDEFNLQIIDKISTENMYHNKRHTVFLLMHKEHPFGLKEA